jgi:hypothetical protein
VSTQIKLWLRRWVIRQLIKLADYAEERLQDWQVALRKRLSEPERLPALPARIVAAESQLRPRLVSPATPLAAGETFLEWEARKSGVAPVSKKTARRRRERTTAGAFDLRYAR